MRRVGSIVLIAALLGLPRRRRGRGSAEAWADDLCGSLNGWVADVDEALEGLTDEGLQLDRADVDEAVDSVAGATDELERARRAGPPETESGQEAQAAVTDLRATLRDDVEAVESALRRHAPLEAVSPSPRRSPRLRTRCRRSYAQLVELDPGGELESALQDAEGCEALRDQLADVGG